MKQTMSFMVVMLAATHFVTFAAVFAAIGGYTFTQMAALGEKAKVSWIVKKVTSKKVREWFAC